MRTRGALTREQAIKIVGGNTVEAVGHVKRKSTGIKLEEGLVEFVASIDAIDVDGEAVIVSAYYYQPLEAMEGAGKGTVNLNWKISGYEVH